MNIKAVFLSPEECSKLVDRPQVDQLGLIGEGGHAQPMSKAALVQLFRVLKENVYLVLLNALPSRTNCGGPG